MKDGGLDPRDFDARASMTIPNYTGIHEGVIEIVEHSGVSPKVWLDTGCGTGRLVGACVGHMPDTRFIMADPSEGMLDIAKERVGADPQYVQCCTGALDLPDESVDVITAVLSHHYCTCDERREAETNCFRMLRPGGIFVTVEHTAPYTKEGLCIGMDVWRSKQISAGKSPEDADEHMKRYGTEYFPIGIEEHMELMRSIGFGIVELFMRSYMQAGFYAIKR